MSRRALWCVIAIAGCSHRSHIASCGDDLHGVWIATAGARWMVLDNGATLEAYPLFDDTAGAGGDLVIAPRVIDLQRNAAELSGTMNRRYMRRADSCEARTPIRITACSDDALELVLSDVSPPVTLGPCTWPPPALSRVERWQRD